jgi:polyphosphate kinase 2 (PPK2 family)
MFEAANLKHRVDKAAYRREAPKLRHALLQAQYDLKKNGSFPILIVIAGVEGAGKSETVNLLNEWMDPRHIVTSAFAEPSDEERERPAQWRFWRALPPKGKIGIFFGGWHTDPVLNRVLGSIGDGEFARDIGEIQRLEKMLADEGVLLLKYWFHLSRRQQEKRLKSLESDPKTRWHVTDLEWKYFKLHRKFVKVCDPFLRKTSTAESPWIVVPGADPRFRTLTAGRHLLAAMRERLDDKPVKRLPDRTPPLPAPADKLNVLRALELDQPLSKEEYGRELDKWQGRLAVASRDPRFKSLSVVAAFEGNDAAGKGGAIRRVTAALDARRYTNVPVGAHGGGARPALPVALLAPYPPARQVRVLRPLLVRARAGRTGRKILSRVRLAARLFGDQRIRAGARAPRHRGGQVLARGQQARAISPLQAARESGIQAVQDHRGRLAQPQEVGRLRARGL